MDNDSDTEDEVLTALSTRLLQVPDIKNLNLKVKDIPLLIKYMRKAGEEKGFKI